METEVTHSQMMADMSNKSDENDARFMSTASPPYRTETACPVPTVPGTKGVIISDTGTSRQHRYLSQLDLGDPGLAYHRLENPNNRTNPRGVCLLINQRDFDYAKTGQEKRDGTDVDADEIERTFIRLGYAITRTTNLTLRKMEYLLEDVSAQNHAGYDSFICVILSHGSNGVIYASDGTIPVDRFIGYFRSDRCPSLVGKPKMFFIQACRGCKFDKGITLTTDAGDGGVLITKLPVEADILVAHSTFPGYFAWRNSQTGSWFIQELCTVLRAAQEAVANNKVDFQICDVASLLTVVARKVALLYESNTGEVGSHGMKQMVSISSTLTRKAYLA